MLSKSTRSPFAIWIACFAILMNALAPSMSHAMAAWHTAAPAWEICRADGAGAAAPAQVAIDAAVAPSKKAGQANMGAMEDCGYCLPHAGSVGLPPAPANNLGLTGTHALRPFLFYRAPQPLLALSAAAPRGPPALA